MPSDAGAVVDEIDVVDAQMHVFAAHDEEHPWSEQVREDHRYAGMRGRYAGRSARPAEILATLDAHGVSGSLLVTSTLYGFDNGYTLEAYALAPSRFRLVGLIDAAASDVEDRVDAWADQPGAVGLRLNLWAPDAVARFEAGADDRLLGAAARHGLTVCVNAPGNPSVIATMARRFDSLTIVVDHLGIFDVAMLDPDYHDDPFAASGGVMALASFENVAVKMTSVPLISRQPWPHRDAAPHLRAFVSAFGAERVMWGSDAFAFDHPYREALTFLADSPEFSGDEKAMLLGGALRRTWGWPAATESEASEQSAEKTVGGAR